MRNTRLLTAIDAVVQRARKPYGAIVVQPLSPVIGAEVGGVDLGGELSRPQAAELRRALLEHHVLVFRDQPLSAAQHGRVGAMLGFTPEPGRRRVMLAAGARLQAVPVAPGVERWRTDETYRSTPPAGAVFHADGPPRAGGAGDMLFANMHLAYDLLSPQLKALLTDLSAVHAPDAAATPANPDDTAEHPVVIRHPVSGRAALFVSRAYTSYVPQLQADHSDMTLDMLCRHLETSPVLSCRVRMTANAVVVWDSRSTQHLTLCGPGAGGFAGHLVSLAGDRPEGWTG